MHIDKGKTMPKFLNTSATTYYLEELIKNSRERLWLISPYLKLNDRIKELLEDKDRLKIDVRIVYGKSELQPAEVNWLKNLHYIRTSYCHNLHAKCYISESACIITSLNLYEFSQVNNNEMGVYIERDDGALYQDAYAEAQRIIRISDEVKISLDVVEKSEKTEQAENHVPEEHAKKYSGLSIAIHRKPHTVLRRFAVQPRTVFSGAPCLKLSVDGYTSKLAEKYGISTKECNQKLCTLGLQEQQEKGYDLTEKGKEIGGVIRKNRFGAIFIVWPEDLTL